MSYFIGISPDPWTTYAQDMLWFLGIILLSVLYKNKSLSIPKIIFPILIIIIIPFLQFILGQIYYFSTGFFSFCFLLSFFVVVLLAYNSPQLIHPHILILYCALFFASIGFLTSVFAIAQWLQLENSFILSLKGSRPYANMGQPNNMATLLMMSICSLVLLYEWLKLRTDVFMLLLSCNILAISFSQSRTVWIALVVLTLFYFLQKQRCHRKWTHTILLGSILSYFLLFYLNVYIAEYLYLATPQSLVERLTSGYLRIEMWKHLFYAIAQQPWFGYGWFQTNIAQLQGVLLFKNEGYLSSAHNIVLDLILWTGIPIGLLIVTYVLYLLKLLFLHIETLSEFYLFALLMCILVHANLEFPLYYSYFLFPAGFFVGLLLVNVKSKVYLVPQNIKYIAFLGSILIYATVFKYYDQWQSHLGYASGMENTGKFQNHDSILFSQFSAREKFLVAQYDQQYSEYELSEFEHYVNSQPSYFNLLKFARILYHNHDVAKAKHYFEISNVLYNKTAKFEEIYQKRNTQSGNLTISYLESIKLSSNIKE